MLVEHLVPEPSESQAEMLTSSLILINSIHVLTPRYVPIPPCMAVDLTDVIKILRWQ